MHVRITWQSWIHDSLCIYFRGYVRTTPGKLGLSRTADCRPYLTASTVRLHYRSWEGADRRPEHSGRSSEGRDTWERAGRETRAPCQLSRAFRRPGGPPGEAPLGRSSSSRPRRSLTGPRPSDPSPFPVRRPPTRPPLAAYTCPQSTRTGFSYTSKHTGHV